MCGIFGIANHSDASQHDVSGPVCPPASGTGKHRHFLVRRRSGLSRTNRWATSRTSFPKMSSARAQGRQRRSATRATPPPATAAKEMLSRSSSTARYGTVALVHNGNLINAVSLREDLEQQGAIFQSTSDSEVILHLLARSQKPATCSTRWRNAVAGSGRVFAAPAHQRLADRRSRSERFPAALNLGKLNGSYVLASETCAFDLIGATVRSRSRARRNRHDPRRTRLQSVKALHAPRLAKCIFEHVYFSRPDSIVFGRTVQTSRDLMGRILAQRESGRRGSRRSDSRLRSGRGDRLFAGIRHSVCVRPDSQSLRRPHVYRAEEHDPQFRREGKTQSGAGTACRKACHSDRRLHRSRHDQPQDCEDGSRRRSQRSPHADQLSADDIAVFLRNRHADKEGTDRLEPHGRRNPQDTSKPIRSPI